MARRERVRVAVHVEQRSTSLENWKAEHDAVLDAAITSGAARAKRAIDAANPDGPRAVVQARPLPPDVVWADEIAVVRAVAAKGPPLAKAAHGMGGELGRAIARRDGGSAMFVSASAERYEPRLNDAYVAAWTVWQTLGPDQRARLVLAYVAFDGEPKGAVTVAAEVRSGKRVAPVAIVVDGTSVTPWLLIASREGRLTVEQAAEEQLAIARAIGREVTQARRAFRDRLRFVELDTSGESLRDRSLETERRRSRPRLLVPPATLAERDRDAAVITSCCVGDVVIADGVRAPCVQADLVLDASSFPRCESCGYPRKR